MTDRGHQLLFRTTCHARGADAVPDADLVRRVAREADRAAFELLLWRHGPAVWGVCRRVLGPTPDAEDVFQVVFLTLSRRAGAIADGAAVAGWLYRVAVRTALEAARARTRRTGRETPTAEFDVAGADDPVRTAVGREVGAVLDAEIARLPERYRVPFLLCEVYGRDRADVAAELRCAPGTVASRVSRAKDRLRARLRARGLALPAGLAVAVVPAGLRANALRVAFASPEAVPAHLLAAALRITGGFVGTVKAVACTVAVAVATVGLFAQPPKGPPEQPVAAPKAAVPEAPRGPRLPLPDGAVAQIRSRGLRHPGMVRSVAYSPDGRWIASVGDDGSARVWDARTGDLKYQFPLPGEVMHPRVAFMDNGKVLWVAESRYSQTLRVRRYSMADGKELPTVLPPFRKEDNASWMSSGFDPAGRVFAYTVYTNDHSEVTVVDAATGKQVGRFAGVGRWSMEPVLAPGGAVVACPCNPAGESDNKVRLFRTETGAEIASFDTGGAVQATAFSADGRLVATSSIPPKGQAKGIPIAIWDAATGKRVREMDGPGGSDCLAFSPDGKTLATAAGALHVALFDVASGKEVRRFDSPPSVAQIAFSPDGTRLIAGRSTQTISVWDVATGEEVPPSADSNFRSLVRFVDDDRLLYGAMGIPGAVVYDWRTGRPVERSAPLGVKDRLAHGYYVASPDRKLIATSHTGRVITLWDATTGAEVRRLEGHTDNVGTVAFAPDGATVYSLGYDQTVRAWETATGKELRRLALGENKVDGGLRVSPDGRWLAVDFVAPGPVLRVWDLRTWAEVAPPRLPSEFVYGSAFSPDGAVLVVSGGSRHKFDRNFGRGSQWVIVWDMGTQSVRARWETPTGVGMLAFAPDGRSLVGGGFDGATRVWETATGTERRAFAGHEGKVFQVAVAPGGRHAASHGSDGLTFVWDLYARPAGEGEVAGDQVWADLSAVDGAKAFAALRRLIARPADGVTMIRDRLKPAAAVGSKRLQELLAGLDSDRFAVREGAMAELRRLGREVEPALRAKLAAGPSAEVGERVRKLLEELPAPTPDELREGRAVEVLERIGSPEAVGLLKGWAADEKLRIAPAAGAAVKRLGK
jgi:RNA polymerase sigma factor (sigma-70 family)